MTVEPQHHAAIDEVLVNRKVRSGANGGSIVASSLLNTSVKSTHIAAAAQASVLISNPPTCPNAAIKRWD
jgi:hypothetical protein